MAVDYAGATIEWGTTPDTITLLELTKQLLGIVDNSRDTELSMYLDMAGRACELYCDNKLVEQDVVEELAMSRSPVALRYWLADTLSSVTIDGVDETANWTMYRSDGVAWITESVSGHSHSTSFDKMAIGYTAGFNPLPSEVGYAISTVAISYDEAGGSSVGSVKKEVVTGVGSLEYVTASDVDGNVGQISPAVIGVLEKYKRLHV
jgi:hypothetical protein